MHFQWYPGHMTKARRMMQENIKLIDLIIELVDARVPLSSRNPDIDELGKNKYRLILMNKADLADKERTREWSAFFKEKGFFVVSLDARSKSGMKNITDIVMEACKEKIERDRKRGIKNRPVRAMVVGIPNVGKSTFINSYAGKACAKTGNKPGVTKGKQWIRLNKSVELLDTPGILWPKFEDQTVGLRLALIGSIKDEILNVDELAVELSQAPHYFETAMNAVAEMVRQIGSPAFSGDMLKKGVIVRHLVLPYHYRDSVEVIKRVGERFGKHVLFSLMSQYTPFWKAKDIPQLNRRITTFEYRKALDAVYEAGLEGFMQERSSAREEYTPDFDLSGI